MENPAPEPHVPPEETTGPAAVVQRPAEPGHDQVDEAGEESFPASDSPSFNPLAIGPPSNAART